MCIRDSHYGAYEHMPETFAELFAYAETNGYEVIDRARFCHIDGIWNKETVDEGMTEIQLPDVYKRQLHKQIPDCHHTIQSQKHKTSFLSDGSTDWNSYTPRTFQCSN